MILLAYYPGKGQELPSAIFSSNPKDCYGPHKELNQHHEVVSGGDKSFQFASEVKDCTLEEREKILEDLQSGIKVVIPTSHALAMKADLGIPWSKLRALRRSENMQIRKQYYSGHNNTDGLITECS